MDHFSALSYTGVTNVQKWSGFYGLNYLVFSVWYGFPEFTQRIFKCDDMQNTHFASDKELNILVYRTPSYVIKYRSYILSKRSGFSGPPCIGSPVFSVVLVRMSTTNA